MRLRIVTAGLVRVLAALTLLAAASCSEPSPPPTGIDAALDEDASLMVDAPPDGWFDPTRLPDGAPNPCLGARDCEECASRTPCGWCNGSCLAGDTHGAWDLTCSGDSWLYRPVQCPGNGTQCPMHPDCLSCAMDENSCGWCENTHSCVAGDRVGPAQSDPGCTLASGTYIYNTNLMTCP